MHFLVYKRTNYAPDAAFLPRGRHAGGCRTGSPAQPVVGDGPRRDPGDGVSPIAAPERPAAWIGADAFYPERDNLLYLLS
jgi:hypothetical protein